MVSHRTERGQGGHVERGASGVHRMGFPPCGAASEGPYPPCLDMRLRTGGGRRRKGAVSDVEVAVISSHRGHAGELSRGSAGLGVRREC
jgi:hypothetical protein